MGEARHRIRRKFTGELLLAAAISILVMSQVKTSRQLVDLTSMRRANFDIVHRDNSQQTKIKRRPRPAKCRPVSQERGPITTRPTAQGRGFQP
eukprot:1490197-Prymnesium_polylepis.1